jgi:hypothetical protein
LSTLEYMGKRLDTVAKHTRNVDEFQQALAHIEEAATKRMPVSSEEAPATTRKGMPSRSNSIFSPALGLKPTKSLDLPPALQDALRNAGISFNQDSIEALLESVKGIQLEREKKLQDHYKSASTSVQGTLAERLSKADGDLKSITKGLYSHTPFHQVHLADPKLEEELRKMEKQLDEAEDQLLSAEANELSLSDPKVRAFIAKYGK